jgi:hypothetical protein
MVLIGFSNRHWQARNGRDVRKKASPQLTLFQGSELDTHTGFISLVVTEDSDPRRGMISFYFDPRP